MNSHDLARVPSDQLAKLLDIDAVRAWAAEDSAAILRCQLNSPLLPELAQLPGAETQRLRAELPDEPHPPTLLEYLLRDAPSAHVLDAIKRFARLSERDPDSPLRGAAATVIYYAAVAAAQVHLPTNSTKLTPSERVEGLRWSKDHAGAEPLQQLFLSALESLGG